MARSQCLRYIDFDAIVFLICCEALAVISVVAHGQCNLPGTHTGLVEMLYRHLVSHRIRCACTATSGLMCMSHSVCNALLLSLELSIAAHAKLHFTSQKYQISQCHAAKTVPPFVPLQRCHRCCSQSQSDEGCRGVRSRGATHSRSIGRISQFFVRRNCSELTWSLSCYVALLCPPFDR